MTREEARLILQKNLGILSFMLSRRISEAIKVALEVLSQPSFPSNLDEAAEEYCTKCQDNGYHLSPYSAFKVGAEWMAKQGYIEEGIARPDDCEIWVNLTGTDIKDGDKVIVQIRKK